MAFFYAGIANGGLGLSSLRYAIPVMKRRRLEKVLSAADPILQALFGSSFLQKLMSQTTNTTLIGHLVTDKQSLLNAWGAVLHTKVNGRGFSEARACPLGSRWVSIPGIFLVLASSLRSRLKVGSSQVSHFGRTLGVRKPDLVL